MKIGNGQNFIFTDEGGFAIWLINKTGAPSAKGTLVNTEASIDNAVAVTQANEPDIIGVI